MSCIWVVGCMAQSAASHSLVNSCVKCPGFAHCRQSVLLGLGKGTPVDLGSSSMIRAIPSECCRCSYGINRCSPRQWHALSPVQMVAKLVCVELAAGRRTGTLTVWCLCLTGHGRQPSRSVRSWGCLTGRAWSRTGGLPCLLPFCHCASRCMHALWLTAAVSCLKGLPGMGSVVPC